MVFFGDGKAGWWECVQEQAMCIIPWLLMRSVIILPVCSACLMSINLDFANLKCPCFIWWFLFILRLQYFSTSEQVFRACWALQMALDLRNVFLMRMLFIMSSSLWCGSVGLIVIVSGFISLLTFPICVESVNMFSYLCLDWISVGSRLHDLIWMKNLARSWMNISETSDLFLPLCYHLCAQLPDLGHLIAVVCWLFTCFDWYSIKSINHLCHFPDAPFSQRVPPESWCMI